MINRRQTFCLAACLGLTWLATGCSSFNHDWNAAEATPPADALQGRWQGMWVSYVTGHTDQLRCLVTKKDDQTYLARFRAKYHSLFTFNYTVPLKVTTNEGVFKFSGDADLGSLAGGMYHYEGQSDGATFTTTYTNQDDHGIFKLERPVKSLGQ